MAQVAKVEISIKDVCPELFEVGRVSMALFDAICENQVGVGDPSVEGLLNDWSTATVNLKSRLLFGDPNREVTDG